MNNKYKDYVFIGVLILFLIAIIYQYNAINQLKEQNRTAFLEQKQLADSIIRAQSSYASKKDIDNFSRQLDIKLEPIKKDLESFGATLKGINAVEVTTPGVAVIGLPSTSTTPRVDKPSTTDPSGTITGSFDTYGYFKATQHLELREPFSGGVSVPWGSASFSAWKKEPWDLTVKQRTYGVVNVLGQDEDGRHYVYNKFSITVDGKKYDIPIQSSKFIEKKTEAEFRFDPHLVLGVGTGANFHPMQAIVGPNLNLFVFSHGRTKVNPDWMILGIGAGYQSNNNATINITPAMYNVGKNLPLIRNLYIGPSAVIGFDGNVGAIINIGLSF